MMEPSRYIPPMDHPLAACVSVPGSKSQTNRALLLSALSEGTTRLRNALFADDSTYFARALRELGFEIQCDPGEHVMVIHGSGGQIPAAMADLFIGNAGTAARFLTAMLTLGHGRYSLDGVARMRQRPIGDLVVALNNLGAKISATTSEYSSPDSQLVSDRVSSSDSAQFVFPPIHIQADGLSGGSTEIRGDTSSQFLSALLMVAPKALTEVEITVSGPLSSRPYIDLTLAMMADFGVEVGRQGYQSFCLAPQQYRSPGVYWIESDATSASYFLAAPAICGGWIVVDNISRNSRQGDIHFVDLLAQMGCTISTDGKGLRVAGPQQLRGVEADMSDISDTALTLAAIAPFAITPTTIRNIASSRLKETDRIAAACIELRRLGVQVDEHSDGMTIYPCDRFLPATIQTYDDHRIAMAFSLIGLRVPGVQIVNPDCVGKTFPNFFKVLDVLR